MNHDHIFDRSKRVQSGCRVGYQASCRCGMTEIAWLKIIEARLGYAISENLGLTEAASLPRVW